MPRVSLRPTIDFMAREAAGGVVLLAAAAVAMLWANLPGGAGYERLWTTGLPLDLGVVHLEHDLRGWVNEALMVLFFLVVGLEIKRELVAGELRDRRTALLPIVAAAGGMVVPAGMYALIAGGGPGADGWAIPMATDIAFAVGVVTLLGTRVPVGAKLFLLTLAIVDDIGAIIVIALFYSHGASPVWALVAAGAIALTVVLRRLGVQSLLPYLVTGTLLWLALTQTGVHGTLAGVVMGLLTPVARIEGLEHRLQPLSALLVVPIFALANAGVRVELGTLSLDGRVFAGVAVGLVVGKVVGVTGATWLGVRLGLGGLPTGASWRHIIGVGLIAGIGFTVALFLTALSFDDRALVTSAKLGVLCASVVAGVLGFVWLCLAPAPGPSHADLPE